MRLRLFDGLVWHSSQLDDATSRDRDAAPGDVEAAVGRRDSLLEIMNTVNRLTVEWNESDRIDSIVRLAMRLDEARQAGGPLST